MVRVFLTRLRHSAPRRAAGLALCAVFAIAAVIHASAGSLTWTGDEVGYVYEGVGLSQNHAYYPTRMQWDRFLKLSHVSYPYYGKLQKPANSLAVGAAYGFVLADFGLEAARWLSYAFGCAGLVFLYRLLVSMPAVTQRISHRTASLATVGFLAFSIPLIAYLQLVYPEALLFAFVAASLYALYARSAAWTILLGAALPWIHIRALPLMAGLYVLLFVDIFRRTGLRARYRYVLAGSALVAIAAFAWFQISTYGGMTGGAFSTRPPGWSIAPERLGMQLFDVRHGALAYAPILFFGFAGLVAGVIRRDRAAFQSAVLLTIYVATFMWSNAGESWSARFWVAGLPFLAVGIRYWLGSIPDPRWLFLLFPALLLTWFNTYLFATNPMAFLSSRRYSVPYTLLESWTHLHPGLFLPVDADPGTVEVISRTIPALLVYSILVCAGLTVAVIGARRVRKWAAIASVTLLAAPYAACAVRNVHTATYSVAVVANPPAVELNFKAPLRFTAVQFDDTLTTDWFDPAVPRYFEVSCRWLGGRSSVEKIPSAPLVLLNGCSYAETITFQLWPRVTDQRFYRKLRKVELLVQV